jgi:hypothetical protein
MASLEMDRTPVRMIGLTTNNITVMCVKAMNKADMLYDQAVELQKSVTASGGRGSAQMLADFSADLTTEPYRAYGTILGGYHYFVGRALQDLRNIIVSQASGMIQSNKDQRKTASDLVNQFISENKETLSSWVGDVAGDSQLADAILNGSVKILEKLDSVIASTYKRLADETVEEESKTKTGVDGDEEEDEETTTPVTDSELTGEEEDTGNDLTDNLNELREMAKGNLDSQAQIPGVTDQEEYKDIMAEYGKLLKPSLPGANADSSARKEYSDYETSVSRLSSRLADYINDNGFVEQAEEELEEQE